MNTVSDAELHTIYFGHQDTTINQLNNLILKKIDGVFFDRRIIHVNSGSHVITFSSYNDAINNLGYSNMRIINCNPDSINNINLLLGGCIVDTIYPKLVNRIDRFPIIDMQNVIPALGGNNQHSIEINCDHDCDFVFDVIKLNEPIDPSYMYQQIYMSTQFSGTDIVINDVPNPKLNISYSDPVHKIELFTDKPIANARLQLDNYIVHLNKINDQNYEYNFSHSVNFSRIESKFMLFDFVNQNDENVSVNIFAHASNIIRFCYNMVGPMYGN